MRGITASLCLILALTGAFFCALPSHADLYVVAGGGKNYKNVLVVAQSGSPYTSVQAALDAISGASDTNRYLIFVAPGTYTGRFTMEPYVDIAGSGPNVTILESPGGASFLATSATGVGADNATLSNLTVKNTGGAAVAVALWNAGVSPSLWHVDLWTEGATSSAYGFYVTGGGAPQVRECTITTQGGSATYTYGVSSGNSSPTFQNCDIVAYDGGTARGAFCSGSMATFQDCRITASGGSSVNEGLHNTGLTSTTELFNCQVLAQGSGSADQVGIFNTHGILVKAFGTRVEAEGGLTTVGIANKCPVADSQIDSLYANRCSIRAQGASSANTGIYSTGKLNDPRVKVYLNQCDIEGATNTVANGAYVDTYIGACWLKGGDTDPGTDFTSMTCAGCYGDAYNFAADSCP